MKVLKWIKKFRIVGIILGYLIWMGFGITVWLYYVWALQDWLGTIKGFILGIITAPGYLIFPIVYWIVEDYFPTAYFILWGISLIGIFLIAICKDDE